MSQSWLQGFTLHFTRELKIRGRDELGRLPKVNLLNRACAREFSTFCPFSRRIENLSILLFFAPITVPIDFIFSYFDGIACKAHIFRDCVILIRRHSRPQRPRSFWSALKITTSGQVQRHSAFKWLCKHNRLIPEPIRFVRLDSEHAQSNGKSVNRGLPELDLARGRDFQC